MGGAEFDFVRTGPGTVAGRYLRGRWQPVWVARELAPGKVVPIRILSEDFALYRTASGEVHVIPPRCPHRGMQLSASHVIGEELECPYHGWRFGVDGRCVAQPGEARPFSDKVAIATIPTVEAMGLIFVYLGELPAPKLPVWPELNFASRHRMDCNYFQSAENIVDDVHVQFVHRAAYNPKTPFRGIPRVTAEERDFGLTQYLHHEGGATKQIHYFMPNACYVRAGYSRSVGQKMVFWYVPITDDTHQHYFALEEPEHDARGQPARAADSPIWKLPPQERDEWFSVTTREILEGKRALSDFNPPSLYFRLQDSVMTVGQGAICDRSADRLGTSDGAVILLRKLWRRELRRLAEGMEATPFALPESLDSCDQVPTR